MKIAYKLRFIPALVSVVIVLVSYLKLSLVSLPYQDPTAEMLQKQSEQISSAETGLLIGGILFVASVVFCIVIGKMHKR